MASHPTVRETATGYRVTFTDDVGEPAFLTLDCDYLEQATWGLLTSLTVRTNVPTARRLPDGVVLIDRINLLKGRDLKDVAFRVGQLIDSGRSQQDWLRYLETAAVLINAELQRPVMAQDLHDAPLPPLQPFLIEGLLALNKANVIYGPGGTGKSVLAVRIAAALSEGEDLFGLRVRSTGRTLYLDWEDDANVMVERMERVSNGMGVPRIPMVYKCLHGKGPYERHHADVREYLKVTADIRLVVIDSTAMALHGSTNGDTADGVIKLYALVSQLPVTVLLIDHVAGEDIRSPGSGAAKPYGSIFKVNSARNVWEVRPWNPEAGLHGFDLHHRKTNISKRHATIRVGVHWDDQEVVFEEEQEIPAES